MPNKVLKVAKETKAAEPKGHHYVPVMYLRGFTGAKDQLFVIDRPTKKPFRTAPGNVAKIRQFNRVEVEGMDPNAIEKALSEFEGEVAPALERIKAEKSLAVEADRSLLVNFMAAIALRNPRRRRDLGKIISIAKRKDFANSFGTREKFGATVGEMKAKGAWNEKAALTFEELGEIVKDEDFLASKEEIMIAEIDHHDGLTEQLWNRRWQMLIAADDSGGFVTTDDPVCLRWSDGSKHGGMSPGFAMEQTEVIFPLSTKLALRGTFEGEEDVVDASAAMVARTNSLIVSNAENQVYAHDHAFRFLRQEPEEIGSGSTLLQDKNFLEAGKMPEEGNVVALRAE
jgi:hypothetical protein